jgi:hypothetical protein
MFTKLSDVNVAEKADQVVRWQIISIPPKVDAAEFKNKLVKEGWEVVAETTDVKGGQAYYIEMADVDYFSKCENKEIRLGAVDFNKSIGGENATK